MKIDYQIVSFHKPTASIQVKYFNDDLPTGVMFSLNLPVVEGRLPQGQALEDFVLRQAPLDMFERAAALRQATAPAELEGLSPPDQTSIEAAMQGQVFVREGGERIFLVRPLIQIYSLDVPLEVL